MPPCCTLTAHSTGRGKAWPGTILFEGTERVLLHRPRGPLAHQSMRLVLLGGLQHDGGAAEAAMNHSPPVQRQNGRRDVLGRAQDGPHVAWTAVRDGLLQELAPLGRLLQQQCHLCLALGSKVEDVRGGAAAMSPCHLHQQQYCIPTGRSNQLVRQDWQGSCSCGSM